jgi:hypothetical protein
LLLVLTVVCVRSAFEASFEHCLFAPAPALITFIYHLLFSLGVLLEMSLTPSTIAPKAQAEETVPTVGVLLPRPKAAH